VKTSTFINDLSSYSSFHPNFAVQLHLQLSLYQHHKITFGAERPELFYSSLSFGSSRKCKKTKLKMTTPNIMEKAPA